MYPRLNEEAGFEAEAKRSHSLKLVVRTCQETIQKGKGRLPTINFHT